MPRSRVHRVQVPLLLELGQLERLRVVKTQRGESLQSVLRRAIDRYCMTEGRPYLPKHLRLTRRHRTSEAMWPSQQPASEPSTAMQRPGGSPHRLGAAKPADRPAVAARKSARATAADPRHPRTVEDLLILANELGL